MKKIIIIIVVCFGFTKLQGQTFIKYADTANYLIHEIENKKNLFVNQPLSVLLDSLKIQPVDAIAGARLKADFGKRIRFYFNHEQNFNKKHFIIVKFDTVPNYDQLFPVFYPAVGRASVQSIIAVYNTLIVKDVLVKDYMEDEPVNSDIHY